MAFSVEQVEPVVALAMMGMHINGNGAQPVTCLLWPVLRAEQPGRRYEVTVATHPATPIPQGVWIMHAPSSERKLICGLAYPPSVMGPDRTFAVDVLPASFNASTNHIPKHTRTTSSKKSRI